MMFPHITRLRQSQETGYAIKITGRTSRHRHPETREHLSRGWNTRTDEQRTTAPHSRAQPHAAEGDDRDRPRAPAVQQSAAAGKPHKRSDNFGLKTGNLQPSLKIASSSEAR